MDEISLKNFIKTEIENAIGYEGGELASDRADAMDYYLGEKTGIFAQIDDDHSSVVSMDVQEVVELMMPALMRTFSGDEIAVFDPEDMNDEKAAEQETDYTNYIFMKKNNGWFVLYQWIKDALLQKNGIVKVCWEESEEKIRHSYNDIPEDMYLLLNQEMELVESTKKHLMPEGPMEGEMEGYPAIYDAVFVETQEKGEAKVYNVAPENFGISSEHSSIYLEEANFCYEKSERTASELIEAGYDKNLVMSLPYGTDTEDEEELARKNYSDEQEDNDSTDPSMRTIEIYDCYAMVDFNNDGVAELRHIVYAGNQILENEEADRNPFVAITPIILTHKFYGLSMHDRIGPLQEVKTAIWRNALDNIYQSVNQRIGVNELVNLEDVLTTRPSGVVRVEGEENPGNSIFPVQQPPIVDSAMNMIAYIDQVRENRSGVSQVADLADDLLANNKGDLSVAKVMSVAEQQVELVARTVAETGIKTLYLMLHELIQKHQDYVDVVKLRGEYVQVDPREWKERKNMTVKVGLGTDDKFKQLAGIQNVINQQQILMQSGLMDILITEDNIYQAQKDLTKLADLHGDKYFQNPNQIVGIDPQTGQEMTLAQAVKQQRAQQAAQQQNPLAEAERIKADARIYVEEMKQNLNTQLEKYKEDNRQALEVLKAQLKDNQINKETMAKMVTDAADRAAEAAKSILDGEIKLLIEGVKQDIGKPGVGAEVTRVYDTNTGRLL